jgi:hypothetical protein
MDKAVLASMDNYGAHNKQEVATGWLKILVSEYISPFPRYRG